MPKNKKSNVGNLRQKYVEGIKDVIIHNNININDIQAYCSINFPYCKPEFTIETLENLKKLGNLKVDGDGILYIV